MVKIKVPENSTNPLSPSYAYSRCSSGAELVMPPGLEMLCNDGLFQSSPVLIPEYDVPEPR